MMCPIVHEVSEELTALYSKYITWLHIDFCMKNQPWDYLTNPDME